MPTIIIRPREELLLENMRNIRLILTMETVVVTAEKEFIESNKAEIMAN